MIRKKYCLTLMIVVVFVTTVVLSGCAKKLDEPVFVKSLICGSDMDTEIEFITNKDYDRSVKSIEIPNLPEGMSLDYYDERIENWLNYAIHMVYFGVGADELSEDGGLKEDFVFHEMIIKWDDGSETVADIGTIHMTAREDAYKVENTGGEYTYPGKNQIRIQEGFVAKDNLKITGIEIPYIEEVSGSIIDLQVGDIPVPLSKDTPVKIKKGESFSIICTVDQSALMKYGDIELEGFLTGETANGEAFTDSFYIGGFEGRKMPEWIETQIANSDIKE